MWLFLSACTCDVGCFLWKSLWFLLFWASCDQTFRLLLSFPSLCHRQHLLVLLGVMVLNMSSCFIQNTSGLLLFLALHSCMNWIETQRGKSFWTTSSASCKKGVCNCARVCVCAHLRSHACSRMYLSDLRQSRGYLSFTDMGGVFIHFGDRSFLAAEPLTVPRL